MSSVTTTGRSDDLAHQKLALRPILACHFKTLTWLATFIAVLVMHSVQAQAAKQKTPRKEVPKGKANPVTVPVRKVTNIPTQRTLLSSPFPQPFDPFEKREHMTHRVRADETIFDMLGRYGLPETERQQWTRSMTRDLGRQVLPVGRDVHLYFSNPILRRRTPVVPGKLNALEIDQDDVSTFTWEKGIKGILFQKREKPYDVEVKTVSGAVETSLFEDGRKAGIQSALLSQLADIFTWDIDIEKEIHQGDTFKILYEQRSRKGQETKSTLRILAAELINAGQKLTAIYFEKQRGQGNYYNLEGRSLARSF